MPWCPDNETNMHDYRPPATEQAKVVPREWPDRLRLRDTGLHDDSGGLGQRIYTTAGAGYEKVEYVRADLTTTAPVQGSGGEVENSALMYRTLQRLGDILGADWTLPENLIAVARRLARPTPPSPGSEGVEGAGEQAGEVEQAIKTCLNVHGDREIAALLTRQASALAQARAERDRYRQNDRLQMDRAIAAEARAAAAVGGLDGLRRELQTFSDERQNMHPGQRAYFTRWIARIDTLLAESGGEGGDGR